MTRIESGAVSPSFDLAQEILTVLGEPIGFTGTADGAARLAVDPSLPVEVTPGVRAWFQRWARIGHVDEAERVVRGQRANLLARRLLD